MARVSMGPSEGQTVEAIGASAAPLQVSAKPATTQIAVDLPGANAAVLSMGVTEPGEEVSRVYLALESVKGNVASGMLDVYLDLPEGAKPEKHAKKRVGSVALFGLNVASKPDGPHGGNGLSYTIDITDKAKQFTAAGLGKGPLKVTLQTRDGHSGDAKITVGRVSLLKRTGKVG